MAHWDRRELNKLIAEHPDEYKKRFPEPFSAMIPEDANSENKLATEKYVNEHSGSGSDPEAVKYTEQTLTTEQKTQARENINAANAETVQELDEKVNGFTVTEWTALEAKSTVNGKHLRSLATSSTTSVTNKTDFIVAKFQVENGNKVRITAQKPAASNDQTTDFFAYSSSLQGGPYNRVASGNAKDSADAGTITNFEFLCSSDGYLVVVGDNSTPPKCELLSVQHTPGIEERVANLENEVEKTENKVQSLDGNESNETKYPSTKAVYNGIHPTIVTTQPQNGFLPNIFYNLGELTGNITFTLATPSDATIVNHYYWTFDTGATAPTITWPNGITWVGGAAPTINSNKHYEISVLNGIGVFMEV